MNICLCGAELIKQGFIGGCIATGIGFLVGFIAGAIYGRQQKK